MPQNLTDFSFEVHLIKGFKQNDLAIGIIEDGGYLDFWSSTGNLDNADGVADNFKKFTNSDIIQCNVQKVEMEEMCYPFCIFYKNDVRVGSRLLKGKKIYPSIRIEPLNEEVEAAEVTTRLGIKPLALDSGN